MNKKFFIIILISLIVIIGINTLIYTINVNNHEENMIQANAANNVAELKTYAKLFMYNGDLYKFNYERAYPTCGTADGYITSQVNENEIPTKDNESNFTKDVGYQTGMDKDTLTVFLEDGCYVFIKVDKNLSKEEILEDNSTYTKAKKTTERLIRINDKFYKDTGKISSELRCGNNDGRTVFSTEIGEIPQRDLQTNFEGVYDFIYVDNNVFVTIDNKDYIFKECDIN